MINASFHFSAHKKKKKNHTHIVLIPKVNNPEKITQYRLISLYNVAYKVILKILTARLKMVMPKVISCSQNAFVPNRHIQDNIILVHELMLTLKRKSGWEGLMAVKVDMEKAYDKVD